MELMLGATPMSQFDAAATPMYGAFHIAADAAPYHAKTPNTNLDAKNAAATEPPLLRSIDYSAPATDDDDDDDDDDDRGRAARRASPAPTRVRRLIARKLVQVRLDIEPMLRPMRWLPD
ncbi:MAG TPA: hypothetical protein VK636_21735 [Gemmatimonadaceae bacterium]|nr:hypothetical protein [Gemmatimonadaceae bacterium]